MVCGWSNHAGGIFRPHNSKGAGYNAAEFCPNFARDGRNGAEYLKCFVSCIFPICNIKNQEFLQILVLVSKIYSYFDEMESKMIVLQRWLNFYSAAEFFAYSGRKRVGNTVG
jgi:hypothetical protein